MKKLSTTVDLLRSDLQNKRCVKSRRDRVLMRIIKMDMAKTVADLCGGFK